MEAAIQDFMMKLFYPLLNPVFYPINEFLGILPDWAARTCGVGLFISAMIWVALLLNKNYVNRGRTTKSVWTDLRLWTVISMTPHVLVYLYFT